MGEGNVPEGTGRSEHRRERVRSWAMMVSRREEFVTGSMIVALRMSVLVVLGGPGYNGITNQRLSSN
jgi:hypothetical protein